MCIYFPWNKEKEKKRPYEQMRYNCYDFSCDLYPSAVALKASIWPLKQSNKTHTIQLQKQWEKNNYSTDLDVVNGSKYFSSPLFALNKNLSVGGNCDVMLKMCITHARTTWSDRFRPNSWLTENDCLDSYDWLSRENGCCLKEGNKISAWEQRISLPD